MNIPEDFEHVILGKESNWDLVIDFTNYGSVRINSDIVFADLDQMIEAGEWAKRFKEYVKQ